MKAPAAGSALALLLRLSLCLIDGGAGPPARAAGPDPIVERRLVAMGTLLALRVEGAGRAGALAASEAAVREIERAESLLSTWKPGGPIERLNRAAPGQPVPLPREAEELLARVFAWRERTGGAFDPTVLPLVHAWDLRGRGRWPASDELDRALAATGVDRFDLDCRRGLASRRSADAGIDEGAWGKGYALDRAGAALRRAGVRSASLDLGGQVLVLGRALVAIAAPRERSRAIASLAVEDASVSTSGNSERARTVGGRRIGHILDPRTGRPAADFGSATVIAPSGLVADVLSTAFFVLGPREGLAESERLRRAGFANEALFLVDSDGRLRAVCSPGLQKRLKFGGIS
jgi:thiamine biosynthesis lipoprotein